MQHKVYGIYDTAAKAYLPPFHMPRNEMAVRAFTDCVNQKNHQFNEHPKDYTLFFLGVFDDSTGKYVGADPAPTALCTGLSVYKMAAPELDLFGLDSASGAETLNQPGNNSHAA